VLPVRYELGFYIAEDGILHSHSRKSLRSNEIMSYATTEAWSLERP
jgi:hypothetical protein